MLRVSGVTFDFGNTLVRTDRASLGAVAEATAAALRARGTIDDPATFLAAWAEERGRQFRLAVPHLREVDIEERVVHVLGRLRGAPVPRDDDEPWDEAAAAARSVADEVAAATADYSAAFLASVAPSPDAESTLRDAHERGFRLGLLSNWPHAATIDRYVQARGWDRYLAAVVVSQRVGVIKPHRAIFEAATDQLGLGPGQLLHVGDDWAADVVGGHDAGLRVGYLRGHQLDTPLPTSTRTAGVTPDLELDRLAELLPNIDLAEP